MTSTGGDVPNDDATVFAPRDGDSHGTHVAGTLAAAADNGLVVAGVAPEARIMPLKLLGPDGGGRDLLAGAVGAHLDAAADDAGLLVDLPDDESALGYPDARDVYELCWPPPGSPTWPPVTSPLTPMGPPPRPWRSTTRWCGPPAWRSATAGVTTLTGQDQVELGAVITGYTVNVNAEPGGHTLDVDADTLLSP